MKTLLLGAVAVMLAGSMNGCQTTFGPDQTVVLDVIEIEVPATIAPGARFTAILSVVTGGCLSFNHIETDRSASRATVTVWGRDGAKGRVDVVCPADIRIEDHTVEFAPPFTTTFDITVQRPRSDPLTARVRVQ